MLLFQIPLQLPHSVLDGDVNVSAVQTGEGTVGGERKFLLPIVKNGLLSRVRQGFTPELGCRTFVP